MMNLCVKKIGLSIIVLHLLQFETHAQNQKLLLGHDQKKGSIADIGAQKFANCVNNKLFGVVEVEVLSDGMLANENSILETIDSGVLDLALTSSSIKKLDQRFELFDLPVLFDDREHAKRALNELKGEFSPILAENGYELLGAWEQNVEDLSNSVRPITTPEDLEGLKLRAPSGKFKDDFYRALGAQPAQLPYAEVFSALGTGAIDGQETTFENFKLSDSYDVQNYYSLANISYNPTFLIGGKETFSSLSAYSKEVILSCVDFAQEAQFGYSGWLNDQYVSDLMSRGVVVNQIDRNAFREVAMPIYASYLDANPEMKELVSIVESTSNNFANFSSILATRIFSGPRQYPPTGFAAYGIVAFRARPSEANKQRFMMICRAYIASLPHTSETPRNRADQMVTVWPVASNGSGDQLNKAPRDNICENAVERYGFSMAKQALKDASVAGERINDRGPYLLAWSPAHLKGSKNTPVLFLDLSGVESYEQAEAWFLKWYRDIEQSPELWRGGWDLEIFKLKAAEWIDNTGQAIFDISFGD